MSAVNERLRVAVLHDHVTADSPPDEQDNLLQAEEIASALGRVGFAVTRIPLSRDVGACLAAIDAARPDVVFNLVESIEGDGRLDYAAAALLEARGVRFTGAGTRGLLCSGDKRVAKTILTAAGIPTPDCALDAAALADWGDDVLGIVKPACEDASVGIDARSVVRGGARLAAELDARRRRYGGSWFVERFIDGRELNVALLADSDGIEVLPVAEIDFVDYPAGRPRIVDYEAKWVHGSHAYTHTPRRIVTSDEEPALCESVARIALDCHRVLDLGSYARVDFRVDRQGRPFVLEANANPCLSSDAGFVAAAAEAGVDIEEIVERIVDASGASCSRVPEARRATRVRPAPGGACRITAAP